MSEAKDVTDKVSRRVKAAEWFNGIFKTKLEKDAKKLLEMMKASNNNEVRGDTTFYYSRGGLQTGLKEYLGGEPKYVKLGDLSVTYWCDVPKKHWEEFKNDGKFNADLYKVVNELTDKLIVEWGKRAKVWEGVAEEADQKGDQAGIQHAMTEFQKDCGTLQKECETVAIEDIANFFETKVKAYGRYKRYKAKAGAKMAFTFLGIIVAIVAVSTSAHPAAPATLVPALIGLTIAVASLGKQIRDLSLSAESVGEELEGNLSKLECNYLDENGKAKKKTYKAKDLTSGFTSGITGGWSEIKFPSVKSLMGLTDTHGSKLDGLEVVMHDMGIKINFVIDSLVMAGKVIEDNLQALEAALKRKVTNQLKKAQTALDNAQTAFEELNAKFLSLFDSIPEMDKRIKEGLEKNKVWKETLETINKALGSKNWATVGNLFATLALTGIGFASGAPEKLVEVIMIPVTLTVTAIDQLREYTPDIMEAMLS